MPNKPDPFLIDDENPEWTAEDFAEARPAREVMPPEFFKAMDEFAAEVAAKRRGGRPPVGDAPKVHIGFRLAADLVEAIRASGPGYNARVEQVLRKAVARGRFPHS